MLLCSYGESKRDSDSVMAKRIRDCYVDDDDVELGRLRSLPCISLGRSFTLSREYT